MKSCLPQTMSRTRNISGLPRLPRQLIIPLWLAGLAASRGIQCMQVTEMMMAGFGEKENTILHWAAASGSKDVFEAILVALRSHLTRDEVPNMIINLLPTLIIETVNHRIFRPGGA